MCIAVCRESLRASTWQEFPFLLHVFYDEDGALKARKGLLPCEKQSQMFLSLAGLSPVSPRGPRTQQLCGGGGGEDSLESPGWPPGHRAVHPQQEGCRSGVCTAPPGQKYSCRDCPTRGWSGRGFWPLLCFCLILFFISFLWQMVSSDPAGPLPLRHVLRG